MSRRSTKQRKAAVARRAEQSAYASPEGISTPVAPGQRWSVGDHMNVGVVSYVCTYASRTVSKWRKESHRVQR